MRTAPAFLCLAIGLVSVEVRLGGHHGPEKLVFPSKMGKVTFDHAKHLERLKGDCKSCHPKPFPQSKTAPLNYKAGMHKPAEAKKTSCAVCHHSGGSAFESKGNCNKCHVKG